MVERRSPSSQGDGSQGAARQDCKGPQTNRGRDPSKGDQRRHLAPDDAKEASAGKKALSENAKAAALYQGI
jgi:hypothetical protein